MAVQIIRVKNYNIIRRGKCDSSRGIIHFTINETDELNFGALI